MDALLKSVSQTQTKINAVIASTDKLFSQFQNQYSAISKLQSRFNKQQDASVKGFGDALQSLKQISTLTKGLRSSTIKVVHKNEEAKTQDEKGETSRDSSSVDNSSNRNNLSNSISSRLGKFAVGLAVAPILLTKSLDTIVKQNNEQRKFTSHLF